MILLLESIRQLSTIIETPDLFIYGLELTK